MGGETQAIYEKLSQNLRQLMTLQHVHSVSSSKFRNQTPNESSTRVNILVQAQIDDQEEAIEQSINELKVGITSVYEEIGGADAPEKQIARRIDVKEQPGSRFFRLYHFYPSSQKR